MKKWFNKLWCKFCIGVGYVFAFLICLMMIVLPLTGITGLIWLVLKMFGVM